MKALYLIPLLFLGCSVSNSTKNIQAFTKCYIDKMPAPFWVCYQSSFISVGKVHSEKLNRLKQEEAYSKAVTDLIAKLKRKTQIFLTKIKKNDTKTLKEIKDYIILNAIQGESWFNEKEKMIYVQVKIDKENFKNYLLNSTDLKEEEFKRNFNEVF